MKTLKLIILLTIMAQGITAQTTSCKVLLDKISGTYTGDCKDGLANGKGKAIGEDTYIGSFKNGLPDGKGKYIYQNGDVFQGIWENGKKNGRGKFKYSLDGQKQKLTGYWKDDEYVGKTNPDLAFKVTSSTGILSYDVDEKEPANERDRGITISIKSAFTDFAPPDLRIENSSGNVSRSGKKLLINQYFCPLHLEMSYTILVGENRKQCRFIIDIYKEGKYSITLHND